MAENSTAWDVTPHLGVEDTLRIRQWAVEQVLANNLASVRLLTGHEAACTTRAAAVLAAYVLSGLVVFTAPNGDETLGVEGEHLGSADVAVGGGRSHPELALATKDIVHEGESDGLRAVAGDGNGHTGTPSQVGTAMVAEAGQGGQALPADVPAPGTTSTVRFGDLIKDDGRLG